MRMPKLSISAKLYFIFASLAGLTVALAVVAMLQALRHVALTKEFESAFVGAQNVERVDGLIYAVVMESRGIYMSPDIETAKQFAVGLTRFNEQIGSVVAEWEKAILPEDTNVFVEFADRVKKFQEFRRELVRRGTEISPAAGREWGDNDANRTVRTALNYDLEKLGKLYANRSRNIYARMESGMWDTALETMMLGAAALLLAMFGALVIHRSIALPLAAVTQVTEAVAAGNAEVVVPYKDRRDEIGAVSRSILVFQNAMCRNVELNKTVLANAEARARQHERISAEIGQFGADIESSLSELGRLFEQMLAASLGLTEVADLASAKTARAVTSSDEACAKVRNIASATDELAGSISEIDRQVTHANAIATTAVREAARTAGAVKELDATALRISDVVKLITDVAGQTNLLALNATIEAARAGEAGRGFAVVAAEVKALSSQTAKAAEEIGAQIAAMQSATRGSIEAMKGIELTIREIDEISGAIAATMTEQGAATQEIARSAEVAAHCTIDSATEVVSVGQATENTRNGAKSVKILADDLAASAAKIRAQVNAFFGKLHAA